MDSETEKLANLEADLRRDLEAIERVRKILALKNGSVIRATENRTDLPKALTIEVSDGLNLSDNAALDVSPTSLRDTIEYIINANANERWTVQKMLKHLIESGFELKAKEPIYSVGQAMKKIADKERIRVIHRGVGSRPSIYQGKELKEKG